MADYLKLFEPPRLGEVYHISWSFAKDSSAIVVDIDTDKELVKLANPSTKAEMRRPVKWEDLRHTRSQEALLYHTGSPYKKNDPQLFKRLKEFKLFGKSK